MKPFSKPASDGLKGLFSSAGKLLSSLKPSRKTTAGLLTSGALVAGASSAFADTTVIDYFAELARVIAVAPLESVTVAWDANNPVPDGYRLFQRTATTVYNYKAPAAETSGTTVTIKTLVPGVTNCMVVRAYDGSLESADSAEVCKDPPPDEVYQKAYVATLTPEGSVALVSADGTKVYLMGSTVDNPWQPITRMTMAVDGFKAFAGASTTGVYNGKLRQAFISNDKKTLRVYDMALDGTQAPYKQYALGGNWEVGGYAAAPSATAMKAWNDTTKTFENVAAVIVIKDTISSSTADYIRLLALNEGGDRIYVHSETYQKSVLKDYNDEQRTSMDPVTGVVNHFMVSDTGRKAVDLKWTTLQGTTATTAYNLDAPVAGGKTFAALDSNLSIVSKAVNSEGAGYLFAVNEVSGAMTAFPLDSSTGGFKVNAAGTGVQFVQESAYTGVRFKGGKAVEGGSEFQLFFEYTANAYRPVGTEVARFVDSNLVKIKTVTQLPDGNIIVAKRQEAETTMIATASVAVASAAAKEVAGIAADAKLFLGANVSGDGLSLPRARGVFAPKKEPLSEVRREDVLDRRREPKRARPSVS